LESWDTASLDVEPHHPQVLHSDEHTRAIAINLPAGEMLQEHETHERAYVLVASGEVELTQDGDTTSARAGFLAHFEPHERREIRATGDSRVVIILAPWPGEGHQASS